jgi:hypothetical protein
MYLTQATRFLAMNVYQLYAFLWVIPRRLNFICRRFGTLSHLHRQVGVKNEPGLINVGLFININTPTFLKPGSFIPTCLWRWNRQSVPKRRRLNFRRRGITQKKAYNIQNTAKVWNRGCLSAIFSHLLPPPSPRQNHCQGQTCSCDLTAVLTTNVTANLQHCVVALADLSVGLPALETANPACWYSVTCVIISKLSLNSSNSKFVPNVLFNAGHFPRKQCTVQRVSETSVSGWQAVQDGLSTSLLSTCLSPCNTSAVAYWILKEIVMSEFL